MISRMSSTPVRLAASTSWTSVERLSAISTQEGQTPQGVSVGPFSQLRQRATRRARVVLPTPRGPVKRIAWGIRPERMAFRRARVTWPWPETSSKLCGRHLRAMTW